MNLVIDAGNTYTKIAVYDGGHLLQKHVVVHTEVVATLQHLFNNETKLSHGILSVVGAWNSTAESLLNEKLSLLTLNSRTKLPFVNLYKTPETLGIDRIALASAAVEQFYEHNTLIIDVGTCITFDIVTQSNTYLGGAISLGVASRYRALHEFTEKLPLLSPVEYVDLIGTDTSSSMHSGIINGIVFEIDAVIAEYKNQFPNLVTILTGGDANFLAKQLKSTIFVNQNFLLEGLNYILEYNKIND